MFSFYDRQGLPISMETWECLKEHTTANVPYKRIAETILPGGRQVSTVWLGIDHQFGDGLPLIFETMVFPSSESWDEVDCRRYSTEADALLGHLAMVEKWSTYEADEDKEDAKSE